MLVFLMKPDDLIQGFNASETKEIDADTIIIAIGQSGEFDPLKSQELPLVSEVVLKLILLPFRQKIPLSSQVVMLFTVLNPWSKLFRAEKKRLKVFTGTSMAWTWLKAGKKPGVL